MIVDCKAYMVEKLKDIGILEANIRTKLGRDARYEFPDSALILVADDDWDHKEEDLDKRKVSSESGLAVYRKLYDRTVILETTLIGKTEAWVDGKVKGLAKTLDKGLELQDADLDKPIWVPIRIGRVKWDDAGIITRSMYAAQVYVWFKTPVVKLVELPHFEDVVITEDDLNLES